MGGEVGGPGGPLPRRGPRPGDRGPRPQLHLGRDAVPHAAQPGGRSTTAPGRARAARRRAHVPTASTCSRRSATAAPTGPRRCAPSTVALLASRFPYVTPSGVVEHRLRRGRVDGPRAQQIVDGGYADNDGIGTVVDLSAPVDAAPAGPQRGRRRRDGPTGPSSSRSCVYLDNGPAATSPRAPAGATERGPRARCSPRAPPPRPVVDRHPAAPGARRRSRPPGSCPGCAPP